MSTELIRNLRNLLFVSEGPSFLNITRKTDLPSFGPNPGRVSVFGVWCSLPYEPCFDTLRLWSARPGPGPRGRWSDSRSTQCCPPSHPAVPHVGRRTELKIRIDGRGKRCRDQVGWGGTRFARRGEQPRGRVHPGLHLCTQNRRVWRERSSIPAAGECQIPSVVRVWMRRHVHAVVFSHRHTVTRIRISIDSIEINTQG